MVMENQTDPGPSKIDKPYSRRKAIRYERGFLNSSRKLQELKKIEELLRNTLASMHNEMDRLDVEWLQLCNLALPQGHEDEIMLKLTTEPENSNVKTLERMDNPDAINAMEIDITLNKSINNRHDEEEFDSEEDY